MKHKIEYTVIQFKDICGFKVTFPCSQHLWDVNYKAELLDDVKADLFQSLTAKLLYITKIIRSDIEPAVEFFTTRVAKSNVENWKKLIRCISYLNHTVDDVSIIGGFNLTDFFTWFDLSYYVHPNMRSHTGVVISIVYGMLHFQSSKQKLNAKS